MSALKTYLPSGALVLGLLIWLWAPALFQGQTIVHGDALSNGLPLVRHLADALAGRVDLLWTQGLYGGHPIFAEGQGGFASPLNLFVAAVIAPLAGAIYAANAIHFLAMAIYAAGMLGLCRQLGISPWAAAFAALAAVFSTVVLDAQNNLPMSGSIAVAPWCLWALEAWLQRPSLRRAALLGLSAGCLLLGGYPMVTHGAVLYVAARLVVTPWHFRTATVWRRLVVTGAIAGIVGVGVAAIQWLPLVELARLSHRSGGVALISTDLPLINHLRGYLFTLRFQGWPSQTLSVGSALVCILASMALVLPTPLSARGHALGVLLLAQLGAGRASPFFRYVYKQDLIPGLHVFRIVQLYLDFVALGVGLLAAFGLDALVRALNDPRCAGVTPGAPRFWALSALAGGWLALLAIAWTPACNWAQLAVIAVGLASVAAVRLAGRPALAPVLLTLCLAGEVALMRLHTFAFFDPALLDTPASVVAVKATPDFGAYSTYDPTLYAAYGTADPLTPAMPRMVHSALDAIAPSTNLIWGLPSINGEFALSLRRRDLLDPVLAAEGSGGTRTPPGLRLMDLLGVRFVTGYGDTPPAPGLRLLWRRADGPRLFENDAARPRFQLYADAVPVASPEAALALLQGAVAPTLAIEAPAATASAAAPPAPAVGQVQLLAARDASSVLRITSAGPAWLFMADADYPGWRAFVDGRETPIYAAQVLGKAVQVPAGTHEVRFAFRSLTVEIGAAITAVTLALAALLIGLHPAWLASVRIPPSVAGVARGAATRTSGA